MITLTSPRSYFLTAIDHFFPYIQLYKKTRLNNVANENVMSEEFLAALVINCLLTEIELLFIMKIINTTGHKIKITFTHAQAIVFYRTLMALPLPEDHVYFQLIVNGWI